MRTESTYDYALIRVVPNVERQEFINAGVVLYCKARRFLSLRIDLDVPRLLALDAYCDIEAIRAQLELIRRICDGQGPIGQQTQSERFHWLVSPRSTVLQTSPVHCGLCHDPDATLEHLLETMVRQTREG